MWQSTCTCTYMYIHIHVYIIIYIHTHTHSAPSLMSWVTLFHSLAFLQRPLQLTSSPTGLRLSLAAERQASFSWSLISSLHSASSLISNSCTHTHTHTWCVMCVCVHVHVRVQWRSWGGIWGGAQTILGGSRGMLPRKIFKFKVAKKLQFLILSQSPAK